jgi:hypothetical protein
MACTAPPPENPLRPKGGAVLTEVWRRRRIMQKPTEDEIRQRAHEIWERNHRPDGRDDQFWYQAEQELRDERNRGVTSGNSETPGVLPG